MNDDLMDSALGTSESESEHRPLLTLHSDHANLLHIQSSRHRSPGATHQQHEHLHNQKQQMNNQRHYGGGNGTQVDGSRSPKLLSPFASGGDNSGHLLIGSPTASAVAAGGLFDTAHLNEAAKVSQGFAVIRRFSPLLAWALTLLGMGPSDSVVARLWLLLVVMLYAAALVAQPIYFMFQVDHISAANIVFDVLASSQSVFGVAASLYFAVSGRLYKAAAIISVDDHVILHRMRGWGRYLAFLWLLSFAITYGIDVSNFLGAKQSSFFVDAGWARGFAIVVWIVPDALYTICVAGIFPITCFCYAAALMKLTFCAKGLLSKQETVRSTASDSPSLPVSAADFRRLITEALSVQEAIDSTAPFWSWVLALQFMIVVAVSSWSLVDYSAAAVTASGQTESDFLWVGLLWFVIISVYPFVMAGAFLDSFGLNLRKEIARLFGRTMSASKRGDHLATADTVTAAEHLLLVSQSDACAFDVRVGGFKLSSAFWFVLTTTIIVMLATGVRVHDWAQHNSRAIS